MNPNELFKRACKVIPGGVNSPVRAFNAVGGDPIYVVKGAGSRITTVDNRELTDYCCSWGPLLFGHARREIVEAIQNTAADGTSFGINTPLEIEFAELICKLVPYIDKVRLVSSGTEAVMTALRLARGFTGRNKIIKFEGCYHGHSDSMLVSAGSGLITGSISSSAGVPASLVADIFVVPYNDLNAVQQVISKHGNDMAAIIVEPIAGNMGLATPSHGFLEGLRELTSQTGSLLILDEVITGFRLGPTTYGKICGITPDLTTLGKIIGGGMPIGAIGGRSDIMNKLAPSGNVYQAGTLSGNPTAVSAGLAMLKLIEQENPYPRIDELCKRLAEGVNAIALKNNFNLHVAQFGSMFTPFFSKDTITNLSRAKICDTKAYAKFFHGMLENGIYLPPSQFETAFISAAHTNDDIEKYISAAEKVLGN